MKHKQLFTHGKGPPSAIYQTLIVNHYETDIDRVSNISCFIEIEVFYLHFVKPCVHT